MNSWLLQVVKLFEESVFTEFSHFHENMKIMKIFVNNWKQHYFAIWVKLYPPKPLKKHCHSKVLRRGGGKAPNAPKVVDLTVIPLKECWINETFMKLLLVSCFFALFNVFLKRGASGRPKHMKRHCVYKVSEQERKICSKSQK